MHAYMHVYTTILLTDTRMLGVASIEIGVRGDGGGVERGESAREKRKKMGKNH